MKTVIIAAALTILGTNLTAAPMTAFDKTRAIEAVDMLQSVANLAKGTSPSPLDAESINRILAFHNQAVKIINDEQLGWRSALHLGLTKLLALLKTDDERRIIVAYTNLIQAVTFVEVVKAQ